MAQRKKKMKTICFVVPTFPNTSETFVTNHVLRAKSHGYTTMVLTRQKLPLERSSQKELLIKHDILKTVQTYNFKIPKAKIPRAFKTVVFLVKYLKYWLQFKELSFKQRYTILPFQLDFYKQFKEVSVFHIQFADAGLELAKMKAIGLISGDIITTFHGYDAHYKDDNQLKDLKSRYKLLLQNSKYITVNTPYLSTQVKSFLKAEYHTKLRVIPMGIDLSFFKTKQNKVIAANTTVHLISVGRLIPFKGAAYAIQSVKKVVDKGYNVQYTIVGEGEERAKLAQMIIDLKLEHHVFLVGAKNQKEIKTLFESHDLFLMSSVTDTANRAETQGVVTAEAQAMGLPVVAFHSGGVPYTILDGKTGFLVKEKDVTAYAESIITLLENPDVYKMMSVTAKAFVLQHFCSSALASQFFELYD